GLERVRTWNAGERRWRVLDLCPHEVSRHRVDDGPAFPDGYLDRAREVAGGGLGAAGFDGDRAGGLDDLALVDVLRVVPGGLGRLACDHDERVARDHAVDEARERVGEAGTVGHGCHAEPLAADGVALSHAYRTCFM